MALVSFSQNTIMDTKKQLIDGEKKVFDGTKQGH